MKEVLSTSTGVCKQAVLGRRSGERQVVEHGQNESKRNTGVDRSKWKNGETGKRTKKEMKGRAN